MRPPQTAIHTDPTFVRISWTGAEANSDPLTDYEILILTSVSEVYSTETSSCDGSDNTILANNYCDIPLTTLRAAPFNLVQSSDIIATIRARNSIGRSEMSPPTGPSSAAEV